MERREAYRLAEAQRHNLPELGAHGQERARGDEPRSAHEHRETRAAAVGHGAENEPEQHRRQDERAGLGRGEQRSASELHDVRRHRGRLHVVERVEQERRRHEQQVAGVGRRAETAGASGVSATARPLGLPGLPGLPGLIGHPRTSPSPRAESPEGSASPTARPRHRQVAGGRVDRMASFLADGQNCKFPCTLNRPWPECQLSLQKTNPTFGRLVRTLRLPGVLPKTSIRAFRKCKETRTFAHGRRLLQGNLRFCPSSSRSARKPALGNPARVPRPPHALPTHILSLCDVYTCARHTILCATPKKVSRALTAAQNPTGGRSPSSVDRRQDSPTPTPLGGGVPAARLTSSP